MENLKALLGDSYHEGITIDEIDEFLKGKKFIDLKTGQYVDKQKYESLKTDFDNLKKQTSDYESISKELTELKSANTERELKDKLMKFGVSEKSIKYVKSDMVDGTLKNSEDPNEFEKNVKEYLKANPQFSNVKKDSKSEFKIVSTHVEGSPLNDNKQNVNQLVNDAIRNAAGRKIDIEN